MSHIDNIGKIIQDFFIEIGAPCKGMRVEGEVKYNVLGALLIQHNEFFNHITVKEMTAMQKKLHGSIMNYLKDNGLKEKYYIKPKEDKAVGFLGVKIFVEEGLTFIW